MLYLGGVLGLVTLALCVFCVVDILTTDESVCRALPRLGWLLLVVVLPLVGSIAWLIAGRPLCPRAGPLGRHERMAPEFPEYDRPGRFAATETENDAEFLRRCRERADEQRRRARGED